jgi:hypothetical protein
MMMSNPDSEDEAFIATATRRVVALGVAGNRTGGSGGHDVDPSAAIQTMPTRSACAAGTIGLVVAIIDDRTSMRIRDTKGYLLNCLSASSVS